MQDVIFYRRMPVKMVKASENCHLQPPKSKRIPVTVTRDAEALSEKTEGTLIPPPNPSTLITG